MAWQSLREALFLRDLELSEAVASVCDLTPELQSKIRQTRLYADFMLTDKFNRPQRETTLADYLEGLENE